jgi:DNA-binding transcriptional MerR regulator
MLINELSKKTGFSRDTIRFYEQEGIIDLNHFKRLNNRYKNYSEAAVNRLKVVSNLKDFGFSLKEIVEILYLYELDSQGCEMNLPMIESKIKLVDEKITSLLEIKSKLSGLRENCSGNCEKDCELNRTLGNLHG